MNDALPYPLRSDPQPRAVWPEGLRHLPGREVAARIKVDGLLAHHPDDSSQWPLGLPVDKPLAFTVDRYVDERARRQG